MSLESFSGYLSTTDVEIHRAYQDGDDDIHTLLTTVNLKYGSESRVPIAFSEEDTKILKYLIGEDSEDPLKGSTTNALAEIVTNNGLKIEYAVITDMEKKEPNRGKLYGGLVIDGIFYETPITDAVIVALGTGKEIRIGKHTLDEVTELYKEL